MNCKYLIILFCVNFVSLAGVSAFLLSRLIKHKVVEKHKSIQQLTAQERKMQIILEEVTKVSSLLYKDIKDKEKALLKLIEKSDEKIRILENLENATYEVKKLDIRNKSNCLKNNKLQSKAKVDPLHQKIFSLRDKGFSLVDISKMVNKHQGEIELILNLRHVMMT